ncbi:MAG: UDP-N-acetylmuramoyl-tripeptide--D-alanyl-D-alanine ligase [Patescibacteria group bacterium]
MRYIPLYNQLYALQVLEYDLVRFIKWTVQNLFRLGLEKKKALVWTSKARFLFICATALSLAPIFLFQPWATPLRSGSLDLKGVIIVILLQLFPQPLLLISLLVLRPYEIINRRRTVLRAQKIITEHKNLLVIGITGSYGKTTVKEILATVLATKYEVLATPKSYNTLFGIAGIINMKLKPEHEVFIVEMGAYKKGEIAELCRMVRPKIGIITGITNQHLERFGSLENIVEAKSELIQSLPEEGLAVFNLYSQPCVELYLKTIINKVGYSRISKPHGVEADLQAEIISSSPESSEFRVKQDTYTLNLPADHNVSNALAAIAVGTYLGLTEEEIRHGLFKVSPPEHRLQLIHGPENSLIIDDAYSSNPEGARAAIKLITRLPNYPKIIVTPGIVELGKQQFEENKKLGELIAENFDYAVIVNKTNRAALLQGIREGGWSNATAMKQWNNGTIGQRLFITDSLDQATKEIIPQLVKPNSLILFENDLPDIYR